jgi:murein DD-endopeptidase MepM/ murein hydrolase activator NlpD
MSRFTRIILINEEDQGVREFSISRRMVWLLAILGLLLGALLCWTLLTYGSQVRKAAAVPRLEVELAAARTDLARLKLLQAEMDAMRGLQAQLLTILGIEAPASPDPDPTSPVPSGPISGRPAAGLWGDPQSGETGELQALASLVLSPPPDTWPAAGYVSAEYSEGAIAQGERPHLGLDIAGPQGAPILAAADGVVARVGEDPYLGNFVEIQHGLGYLTVYGHCASVAVARAEQVRRGQVIAYLGDSGQASAPHLHFEIWHHGTAVDPREFLSGEPPPP